MVGKNCQDSGAKLDDDCSVWVGLEKSLKIQRKFRGVNETNKIVSKERFHFNPKVKILSSFLISSNQNLVFPT